MPYAEAMVYEEAPINLCPPGGIATLKALGNLLKQDPTPFIDEMHKKAKPKTLAVIREDECIGCTKCIQACPVDAILGSAKQMHTVITSECTGCELCIAPCPVDCIDLLTLSEQQVTFNKDTARTRYNNRQLRLENEKKSKKTLSLTTTPTANRQAYLQAALARAKAKKLTNP